MKDNGWSIEYYVAENGAVPVKEVSIRMAEEPIVNGRQAFEDDYACIMNDPELRALYEYEAQKKELWLQLVEARMAKGLTQRQMAKRLNVSQAQVARIEKAGYDCYTLNTLRHYVEALGSDFTLHVVVKRTDPAKDQSPRDMLDPRTGPSVSNSKRSRAHNTNGTRGKRRSVTSQTRSKKASSL
jgi:transcriptional regulator with XRE-family HTH domain